MQTDMADSLKKKALEDQERHTQAKQIIKSLFAQISDVVEECCSLKRQQARDNITS
jgi:hypothetical protein